MLAGRSIRGLGRAAGSLQPAAAAEGFATAPKARNATSAPSRSMSSSSSASAGPVRGMPCLLVHRRGMMSLAQVNSQQIVTKQHLESMQPRYLKRIKVFQGVPPKDFPLHMFSKLNKCYSNPRSIIKLYREYIKANDHPDYNWLVRCFSQLANCYGFNSYWSVRDKQTLCSTPYFKFLMFDILERRELITPRQVPKLLYAMATLDYRCWQLMPTLLDHIENNMHKWSLPALSNMILSLSLMGVGCSHGVNTFGPADHLSKDYTGLVERMLCEVRDRYLTLNPSTGEVECKVDDPQMLPFDWGGLAFSMCLNNLYDMRDSPMPAFLQLACRGVGERLRDSGWLQFFLYQTLYCTDVEKPANEVAIKKAVPLAMQQELHLRWLDGVVLHAQPQGSEKLQMEVDESLKRVRVKDALINCSAGRSWDEQHCWFAGHLIKSKDLAIEYDFYNPLGPGRPKTNGWLALKSRIFTALGLNVVTIHKCFWDMLDSDQKDLMTQKLLANFPTVRKPDVQERPGFPEDRHINNERFKVIKQRWPIQMYIK